MEDIIEFLEALKKECTDKRDNEPSRVLHEQYNADITCVNTVLRLIKTKLKNHAQKISS